MMLFLEQNYAAPTLRKAALLAWVFLAASTAAFSQDPQPGEDDLAPPPARIISKDERKALTEQPTTKKRAEIAMGLMENRLVQSEKASDTEDFSGSINELASFEALMQDTLDFLIKNDSKNKSADKIFKSFEIYLRKQNPRLEAIRRKMPYKYGYYVERTMKAVRAARSKAIEPIFGNTVLPDDN
jgi:hypothetical protein